MLQKILAEADALKGNIERLKSLSPDYPLLYIEDEPTNYTVSTKVVFTYNGINFSRHHVEMSNKAPHYADKYWSEVKEKTLNRLHYAVSQCLKFAAPCQYDDIISIN